MRVWEALGNYSLWYERTSIFLKDLQLINPENFLDNKDPQINIRGDKYGICKQSAHCKS